MSKNRMINFTKKVTAGFLAAVIIAGTITMPKPAQAAGLEDSEDKVIYLGPADYDIKDYWNTNAEERKAPVKEGYVFGGWYCDENGTVPLTEETATEEIAKEVITAYAKFVPAYVLSVKAQNEEGTVANNGNSSIRVISSVDSRIYKSVGFEILLNNKISIGMCETKNVYSGLKNSEDSETTLYPANEFGSASNYFSVWRLDNINDANDSKIIYVRPYWITPDGTKVEGLAKYVHIEDGYLDYISVPINLLTGEMVAVGTLQLSYDAQKLEFISFEAGRLLPEMKENHTTAGVVNMVGNAATVNENVNADGIYANIRFKAMGDNTAAGLTFRITNQKFCNWAEEIVTTVNAWDIQY